MPLMADVEAVSTMAPVRRGRMRLRPCFNPSSTPHIDRPELVESLIRIIVDRSDHALDPGNVGERAIGPARLGRRDEGDARDIAARAGEQRHRRRRSPQNR